jgi:formate dehydrogenase major subunit
VLAPPGDARPDWAILEALACRLGRSLGFVDAAGVFAEMAALTPSYAGMSHARLDRCGGLQWPCPDEHHAGTTVLHEREFGGGVRAALQPVAYRPSAESADADYPHLLMTGRALEQFNAGSMTGRSVTGQLRSTDWLEIAPADAHRLGVGAGDLVHVTSRYGEATLPAAVTSRVRDGHVFATFNDPARAVNRVTGNGRDAVTNTPEYKVTAVRLAPAESPG